MVGESAVLTTGKAPALLCAIKKIQKMVENDRYCVDILVQISAINAAMKKVGMSILKNHTSHCVSNAIKNENGEESIEELMAVFDRFSKS
ncbi:metal-sensing transcriptional repressor [Bacillus sp. SRB_331]|uniref:metal-sensing transcriptional repressor n=1 Tax=Bacillus sp. SRB_331 TaxID=1969379 RepID=UPI0021AD351B|nr:metal-sensing transcriptional repressor [Bacillus sp. SRB_331]